MQAISSKFDADVSAVWNYEHSVEQYTSTGGTAKSAVLDQITKMEEKLKQ